MKEALNYHFLFHFDPKANILKASIFCNEALQNEVTRRLFPDSKVSEIKYWLMAISKSIMYHDAFLDLEISHTLEILTTYNDIASIIQNHVQTLKNTQQLGRNNRERLKDAHLFSNILFYNVDALNTFEDLYKEISQKKPEATFYENASSGWDKLSRTWGSSNEFTLDELINYIVTHKIGSIFSVNMYIISSLLKKENVFLLPLLKSLNIEWVILDYDTYELIENGILLKASMHCSQFRRFSIWPHLSHQTDKAYQLSNLSYFMIGSATSRVKEDGLNQPRTPLPSIDEVIIISQARIKDISYVFPETLFYLECLHSDNIYFDFQMFYFSLTHLLFTDKSLTLEEKEAYFTYLSRIYIGALSTLKYEVIQSLLDNNIDTKLFGDLHWGQLFPKFYQNKFLNEGEMKEVFSSGNKLYLLLNQNFSYFENNPVFLRAMNLEVPYLCFPALTKTDDLISLNRMEYKNNTELIDKIQNYKLLSADNTFHSAIQRLSHKIAMARDNFHSRILDKSFQGKSYFDKISEEHLEILKKSLYSYFQNNHERIFLFYDVFIKKGFGNLDITQLKFYKKNYFKCFTLGKQVA